MYCFSHKIEEPNNSPFFDSLWLLFWLFTVYILGYIIIYTVMLFHFDWKRGHSTNKFCFLLKFVCFFKHPIHLQVESNKFWSEIPVFRASNLPVALKLFIDIKNPSIYNILRWFTWTMVQTKRRPSVLCSKYSRLWNKRTPWNNRSPPSKKFLHHNFNTFLHQSRHCGHF